MPIPIKAELSKSAVTLEQRMASKARARCAKCNKVKTYLNPLAKCDECGDKLCYDHINCLQFKEGMKQTDELRDICDDCKAKHGYKHLNKYHE